MRVVLVGLPSVGKSTIGTALAERRGWRFVDVDDRMLVSSSKDMSIRDLFKKLGQKAFRALEAQVAQACLEESGPWVCACGGGVAHHPDFKSWVPREARVVYLRVTASVWLDRMHALGRPFSLMSTDLRDVYVQRDQIYRAWADIEVCLEGGLDERVDRVDAVLMRQVKP